METIVLIDYGSGNLRSAEKALQRAAGALDGDRTVLTTSDPDKAAAADRLVLPGVGAFAACMKAIERREGLLEALRYAVRARGAPFLGICVGMQLMATRGLEFGATGGLDWIAGEVRRLQPASDRCKIPHMGWNAVERSTSAALFSDLTDGADMYFTHSYAFFPRREADIAAWTDHGGLFPAAVARDNLAGVQFHPEKSQSAGISLLARFLDWRP